MKAVSPALHNTIQELLNLPALEKFSLGGGTSLAIRYNHRLSIDIDLFSSDIIGKDGFNDIIKVVTELYGDAITGCQFPCNETDQYIFLRFFITKDDLTIKVEALQNFKTLFDPENVEGIRLIDKRDLGLFKLISASNRASNKDIYDLDYITDEIPITELYDLLLKKEEKFNQESDRTIFDLDNEISPSEDPKLLLKFDNNYDCGKSGRPVHSNDRIDIVPGSKEWRQARSNWIKKLRRLFDHIGVDFPPPAGQDIE